MSALHNCESDCWPLRGRLRVLTWEENLEDKGENAKQEQGFKISYSLPTTNPTVPLTICILSQLKSELSTHIYDPYSTYQKQKKENLTALSWL